MIKAIIYVRVSSEEQVHGYSLDNQREKCIQKARELGAHDYLVFADEGVPGEVYNRPALMDAISRLHQDAQFRFFIATDPDRLSRDLANLLVFTGQIERNEVQLIFTDFTREATAEGQLFYSIRGAVAQFEKEMIRRRTMQGRLKKAKERKWTHWPGIYGYDYNEGEVTVNEEQAKVVRLIYSLGTQIGLRSIADRLGELGIERPRSKTNVWDKSFVNNILSYEGYATGKTYIQRYETSGMHLNKYRQEDEKIRRKFNPKENWIEMSIPSIITKEDFDAVQRRRSNARRVFSGISKQRYLLRGLLTCAECGKTWHGYRSKTRGLTYYVCTYKSPGPPKGVGIDRCPTRYVQTQMIDEVIWNQVRSWLESDDNIQAYNDEFRSQTLPKSNQDDNQTIIYRERLNVLNGEEDALLDRLSRERNERLKGKIEERLDGVAAQIDRMSKLIEEMDSTREGAQLPRLEEEIIQTYRRQHPNLDTLTWDDKFDIIHGIVQEIEITLEGEDKKDVELKITKVKK